MAEVSRERDVTVVLLDRSYDALDEAAIATFSGLIMQQAEQANPPLIVLDFTRTAYLSSRVLEILFWAWKRLSDRRGRWARARILPARILPSGLSAHQIYRPARRC